MPPDRSRKFKERVDLANRIERGGFEMSPCSRCERIGRRCIVSSADASRCSECVRQGRGQCDRRDDLPAAGEWLSIDRQRQKLREEEEKASELLQQQTHSLLARLSRLRQQQRFLDQREQEMVRRGLRTLDELDVVEEKEKKERAEAEERERTALGVLSSAVSSTSGAAGGSPGNADELFSSVDLGVDLSGVDWDADLLAQEWRDLGFVGGTGVQESRS